MTSSLQAIDLVVDGYVIFIIFIYHKLSVSSQCRKCSKVTSPHDKSHRHICMVYVQKVKYRVDDNPQHTTTMLVHRNAADLFQCYYCQYKTVNSDMMRVSHIYNTHTHAHMSLRVMELIVLRLG